MSTPPPATPDEAQQAQIDDHDALPPGTRFAELEILRVLGVGGFGIVYLAQDHALERQVALKEYMPSSLAGRGKGQKVSIRSGAHTATYALGLRSFVNEARLLARFNHPSLVKVYRFWEENGTAYMVMPYLQGRTLREVRRAMSAPPAEAWIRSVIDPLLDALELLHREDVYHRDIAPDNVLLPPGELPVLLDFGAARRTIGDRTQTFTAILKPSYAPIEQYAEAVQLRQGPWTDIYALGAVVYYLLRGAPPPPATARAVQDDSVLLAHDENPGISPQFLAAIEWALAVRPGDRPQHIGVLREVLAGRASVPLRTRSGMTELGRTMIMPQADVPTSVPTFAPTRPLHGDMPPTAIEPTRPMTAPPRTRPEVTVMPPTPTVDAVPASSRVRHGLWVVAGLASVVAVVAAGWTLGSRRASGPVEAAAGSSPVGVPVVDSAVPAALPVVAPAGTAVVAAMGASAPARARAKPLHAGDSSAQPVALHEESRAAEHAAAAGPASPREACGSRVFLALAVCMEEQCDKPRYKSHPQCDRVREIVERRHRGESGG
jgi:serine/threonine protein kinase